MYIANPREVARTGSLCLVDFGPFCDKPTPDRWPAIIYFISILLLIYIFQVIWNTIVDLKLANYAVYQDN